jgi:hypothetical protein
MYGERLLVNARSLDILIPNVRCFPRTGAYRFGLLPYDGADLLGGAEFVTESRLVVIFARTMAPEQAGVPAGRAPSRRVLCSSKRHPRPERVNAGPEAKGRDGGARHLPTVNEAEVEKSPPDNVGLQAKRRKHPSYWASDAVLTS